VRDHARASNFANSPLFIRARADILFSTSGACEDAASTGSQDDQRINRVLKEFTAALEKRNGATGETETILALENSLEERMDVLKQLTRLKNALEEAKRMG
jgi:hypothetical protein